jgi:hypothetical protein
MVKKQIALGLRRTNPITQPYVAVAVLRPYHFALCILDVVKRHLIMYPPWQKNHHSHFRRIQ